MGFLATDMSSDSGKKNVDKCQAELSFLLTDFALVENYFHNSF